MGTCVYCGKSAGMFRSHHSECAEKRERGKGQIIELVASPHSPPAPLEGLIDQITTIVKAAGISAAEQKRLLSTGWKKAVTAALHDGVLSEEQEERLKDLFTHFALSREELDDDGTFTRVVKAALLRDLLNDVIPHRFSVEGALPFNLQKTEEIIWAFKHCDYLEDRTHHQHVGASHGVSVRIAKGVYYRTSSFKGHVIDRTERLHVDRGMLALTTKHLYFGGANKSFRIPYGKIVSFRPFADGIGIVRDASNAKPQIFVTHDGWFTYNLASNLARLA